MAELKNAMFQFISMRLVSLGCNERLSKFNDPVPCLVPASFTVHLRKLNISYMSVGRLQSATTLLGTVLC